MTSLWLHGRTRAQAAHILLPYSLSIKASLGLEQQDNSEQQQPH